MKNENLSFFIIRRIGFCGLFPSDGFFQPLLLSPVRLLLTTKNTKRHPSPLRYAEAGEKEREFCNEDFTTGDTEKKMENAKWKMQNEEQVLEETHERVQGMLDRYMGENGKCNHEKHEKDEMENSPQRTQRTQRRKERGVRREENEKWKI